MADRNPIAIGDFFSVAEERLAQYDTVLECADSADSLQTNEAGRNEELQKDHLGLEGHTQLLRHHLHVATR